MALALAVGAGGVVLGATAVGAGLVWTGKRIVDDISGLNKKHSSSADKEFAFFMTAALLLIIMSPFASNKSSSNHGHRYVREEQKRMKFWPF